MSDKAASPAPAEQAPGSSAAPKATSPAPAAEVDAAAADEPKAEAPAADAEPKAEAEDTALAANGTANGNGDSAAPSSKGATRTSSRTKQESSSKPAPKKATGKPAKPRASGVSAAGGSKKPAVSDKDKNFSIGDIILGRLKGYPAWPARIVDPDDIPRNVAAQRPGKNPLTFCVQFFPAGDYSWLNVRDMTALSPTDIKEYLSQTHRKPAGGLREAYQTAQDPTEWDEAQADIRARAKEYAEGEEEVDELEDEDEAEDAPAGGKRKKAAGGKEGKAKKAKTEKKDDSKSKPKAAPKTKAAAKSKSAPESKPVENQAPADDDPMSTDPECVKVKDWRHKLQRAFLGKSLPGAEEMTTYDGLFKDIEEYTGMTIEALQYSKIGKVMKKIAAMNSIPKNDEFKITDRAQKLMNDEFIEKNSSEDKKANGMEVDA